MCTTCQFTIHVNGVYRWNAWTLAIGKYLIYTLLLQIIHRDLAARNVLVGEKETCKVTDFGMARDVQQDNIYERKSKARDKMKGQVPETLQKHSYQLFQGQVFEKIMIIIQPQISIYFNYFSMSTLANAQNDSFTKSLWSLSYTLHYPGISIYCNNFSFAFEEQRVKNNPFLSRFWGAPSS